MRIRELKNKDIFTVINMLKKAVKVIGPELANIISSSSEPIKDAVKEERIGLQLLNLILDVLFDNVQDDLKAWFADLLGVTVDEYMELPLSTTEDVIEYLIESQESTSFFTRAWQLYKRMSGFGSRFTNASS